MYGNCKKKRETCTFLHSIDFALDVHRTRQEKIREKRRKRNRKGEVVTEVKKEEEPRVYFQELTSEIISAMNEELKLKKTGCHRAGVDAFMTGFAVLFQQRMDIIRTDSMNPEFLNRLPLFGKDHPMTFRKSLSKPDCSPDHVAEFAKIQADRQKVLAKQRK
ncbi:unnamed protein product [Caenorhabditis auriculariae]|uniref:C3H1-type domain-containing protein n=1 Tax=Caenorhabditis auriculariae TaxID=2777116 RepID=A0A8S1HT56_9PELO|nr:unnamed protein product [Caenorhabditis auriculariae]